MAIKLGTDQFYQFVTSNILNTLNQNSILQEIEISIPNEHCFNVLQSTHKIHCFGRN